MHALQQQLQSATPSFSAAGNPYHHPKLTLTLTLALTLTLTRTLTLTLTNPH